MYKTNGKIKKVETIIEAKPGPGMSLDQLVDRLKELGNPIKEIDRERGVVLMIHRIEVKEGE